MSVETKMLRCSMVSQSFCYFPAPVSDILSFRRPVYETRVKFQKNV